MPQCGPRQGLLGVALVVPLGTPRKAWAPLLGDMVGARISEPVNLVVSLVGPV